MRELQRCLRGLKKNADCLSMRHDKQPARKDESTVLEVETWGKVNRLNDHRSHTELLRTENRRTLAPGLQGMAGGNQAHVLALPCRLLHLLRVLLLEGSAKTLHDYRVPGLHGEEETSGPRGADQSGDRGILLPAEE